MGKGDVMTQNQKILEHLQSGRTITQLDALNKYGCLRLSGRIFELRQRGYKINTKTIAVRNRDGESAYVAEYSLEEV